MGDGEWSLIDGGTESVSIGGVATTAALFTFVRLNMQGESSISVAHGTDPRRIKKEVVDQGLEPEQPRFFSIAETIELNSDDDEEKLSVTEMVKREGKSLYEAVRPLHMHMQMDLLHLLGFGPVFLCNNRSHLASMIAQKYRTRIEKVAPGSALHSGCPRLRGPRRLRRLRGLGLRSLLGSCPVFLCSYCSHLVLMIAKNIRTKLEKVASGSALERGLRAAGLLGLSGPSHV